MYNKIPFEVPAEYSEPAAVEKAELPLAVGRRAKGPVTVVCGWLSAPVTAGNFIDWFRRNFLQRPLELPEPEDFLCSAIAHSPTREGFYIPATGPSTARFSP
jgi:hypothetical protein